VCRLPSKANEQFAGLIIHELNFLNVGYTPAQCHGDDQNHGDHAETAELFSNWPMLLHFSAMLVAGLRRV
jgi:hypothetical protein